MHAGFACYEAGMVRSKNSVNVALKNIADLGVAILIFMTLGYPLMFGTQGLWGSSILGWGVSPVLNGEPPVILHALFHAMFAGTAVTIMSGVVSERMCFRGYIILTVAVSILIYPVVGHWIWGAGGWLKLQGFFDFAGGTVVHVTGGSVALAATMRVGARRGRFDGSSHIEPSNLALSALGVFLLMFGWFGFNAGSVEVFSEQVAVIMVNTALAGAAGIGVGLVCTFWNQKSFHGSGLLSTMLGGLVCVTSGCAIIGPLGALVLGATGAIVALIAMTGLERLKIDDPVNGVPVHLMAGISGTVLLPFFADSASMPPVFENVWSWMIIQGIGVGAVAIFAFSVAYVFIGLTDSIIQYRVTPDDETLGLNITEHGSESSLVSLLEQMHAQGHSGDFSRPVETEPETEAAHIAMFYNRIREKFLMESERTIQLYKEATHLAKHDSLTGLFNRRAFYEMAAEAKSEVDRYGVCTIIVLLDLDHFKRVNDTFGHDVGDAVLKELADRLLSKTRHHDVVARFGGEEFVLLLSHVETEWLLKIIDRFRKAIESQPFVHHENTIPMTGSFGVSVLKPQMSIEAALKRADDALYSAKTNGRNRVEFADEPEGLPADS